MSADGLSLPARQGKPRTTGLTMMIDTGLPERLFADVIASAAAYVDLVKFGWGTALVTPTLQAKIDALHEHGVDYCFGGTLFEKYVAQGRFDDFRELCRTHGCRHVEVSNGTIDLANEAKAVYVRKLADEFSVLAEVGYKDPVRSEGLSPARWIEFIHEDLDAGAVLVILEARASGKGGICRPTGELRYGLIEELLESGLPVDRLLFEAPTAELQTFFIRRIGAHANLGNVAPEGLLTLETLRLGLRSDTMLTAG